jgi:hypothetical protein
VKWGHEMGVEVNEELEIDIKAIIVPLIHCWYKSSAFAFVFKR